MKKHTSPAAFGAPALITAAAIACFAFSGGPARAASLDVDFQATVASEQHPDYGGEARYYHVSVNPNNPGTGSYAATIVGTNNPAPSFVRNYDGPVLSYKFTGGANNDITSVAASGGDASLITYATTDTEFDGFGQGQAKIWDATDPGSDLQTTGADPYGATADKSGGGYRSLGGAEGTVDISSLEAGSVHIYYGSFNATPSVSVVMRDTDGTSPDIVVANAHLNGDTANRTEYYLAEIDFVNDAGYDEVVFTWDSDGDGDLATGNGRGIGAVLTASAQLPAPVAYWPMRDGLPGDVPSGPGAIDDVIDDAANPLTDGTPNNSNSTFIADPTRGIAWSTVEGNRLTAGQQGIDLNTQSGWTWSLWANINSSNLTDSGADVIMGSRNGTWNKLDISGASNWINPTFGAAGNPANDEWQHIVFVGDATGGSIYVNGVLQNKDTTFNGGALRTDIADDPMEIGGSSRFSEDVTGLYSDVAVWDVALTPEQIADLANGANVIEDTTAPFVAATTPEDDAVNVSSMSSLQAIFDEPLALGTGDIRIVNDTDGVTTTIDVTDGSQVTVSGAAITLEPTVALIPGKSYHIEIDAGAVTNIEGLDFAGIADSTTWNFSIAPPPTTTVTSITLKDANPSSAATVRWDVTFADDVTGLTAANFELSETGSVSGSAITSVSGSGSEYVVAASSGGGCGTLVLTLKDSSGVTPPVTNTPFEGETYTIDTVGPVIECARDIVVSIPAGETTDPVNYETTASDDCSGLDTLVFSPPSGGSYPVGVHPVTVTATDNAGNESTATFNVVVLAIAETPGGRFIDASAVSGDAATGTDVPAGATFRNIYNAYLNNGGEVLFSANLNGGTTGVFSGGSTTGPFTAIAVQGAASGAGPYGSFSDLTLNDAGNTGFASRLSSGMAHFADAAPSAVTGGVAPGTGGATYRSLQKPALASGGVLLTRANLVLGSGAPGVTVFDDTVITGSDGSLLAREGDPTSIGGGVLYSGLDSRVVASEDNNRYAFSANLKPGSSRTNSAVFADVVGAGTPAVFVREGDAAPGTGGGVFDTFRAESVNSNGDVALRGTARGTGINSDNKEAIWTDAGGSLELVAREGDDIPCLPPGLDGLVAFDRFETLAIADDGSVCFLAYLRNATTAQAVNSTNDGSIWRWEDGELYLIAREGDAANNTDGSAIGRLDAFACSGTGGVVYQVQYVVGQGDATSSNRDGIYLDRGDGDAAPELVLRRGDSFDFRGETRTVNGLDISTEENAGGGTGGYGRAINDGGDILLNLSISGNYNGLFVLSEAPPES